MSNLVINDLNESVELDRQAMHAILGGSRGTGAYNPIHISNVDYNRRQHMGGFRWASGQVRRLRSIGYTKPTAER